MMVTPTTRERDGHGISPSGAAYQYVEAESFSRKCGYAQPRTAREKPSKSQMG